MLRTVREYIEKYNMIQPGDEIIAGVSGGADSVCMFLQLIEYKKQCEFTLKVVHINHLIRTDAADDAAFVKELCDRYEVEYHLFEVDVEQLAAEMGLSTEEAGRQVRYERFRQVMASDSAKIAVAHNENDVAETVLFNIFRGTGLEGLASLTPVNGDIIRPLLGLSRDEIESYLDSVSQEFRTDSTNATNDYARNKIRNVILPYAEENISPQAVGHIAELSQKMLMLREYVKKETEKAYFMAVTESDERAEIDLVTFDRLDPMIKREVILLALEKLTPHRKDITGRHVESIIGLLVREGEKKADLPYGLEAVKQYDRLCIRKKVEEKKAGFEYDIDKDGDIILEGNVTVKVRIFDRPSSLEIAQKTYTKWFDYDKIMNCVKLRTRRQGDYLTVNRSGGTKSLKDYFIDKKIPREERDSIPLIADGSHILWAVGFRISEYYKVSDDTGKILEISIKGLDDERSLS